MLILSIIFAGAQSAIIIAAKAVPSPDDQVAAAASASEALSAIADDIAVATAFTSLQATEVEFTVPDRTGDDKPDAIRYAWSGKPGEPLMMSINAAAPTTVVSNVRSFALSYDTAQAPQPQTFSEGAEQVLYSYYSTANLTAEKVKDNGDGCGAWFKPTLPADAVSWGITQVEFYGRNKGKVDSVGQVRIQTAGGDIPSARVNSSTDFNETLLGAAWTAATVGPIEVRGLFPGEAACVTVLHGTGSDEFELMYRNMTPPADAHAVDTSNQGSSWSTPNECMILTVRGRVVRPDPIVTKTVLARVRYSLQAGLTASPTYTGTWAVQTRPEVSP